MKRVPANMATSQASKNRVYLFRLQTLIIDGGSIVIKNIFNQKLQSQKSTLTVCLTQEKQTITNLRTKKVITQPQYDLLFPQSGQAPSLQDFDITLTVSLLRSLKMCGLNKKYDWKATPQPTDLSVEADISRLRAYRNEIAHISDTTGIQLMSFRFKWTEIEQILLRLNSFVRNPVPHLQLMIDDFKTCSMDPEAEERLQKEIDAWREMERGLETSIQLVKKDLQTVAEDGQSVKKEIKTIKEDIKKNSDLLEGTRKRVDKLENLTTKQKTDSYPKKCKDIEEGMISLYRRQHSKCQFSPLLEDDTPLLEFYVKPDILSVTVEKGRGSVKEEKKLVTSFSNVFFKGNKMCSEIYLTADAGLGKTAFSKRLALAWCHARKPLANEEEYFSMEEIGAMSTFRFVFLVLLRDSSSECDIDDLILKQIISNLPYTGYTLNVLQDILANEICLVILDGLDEWTRPSISSNQGWSSIPQRKLWENTVVLTTTRPWKLSVLGLTSSQIDQKLEITGLNPVSANTLKRSVLSHLFKEKDEKLLESYVTEFTKAVEDNSVSDLEAIPLLLTYMLFLWYFKIELGKTQCDLYSNIVELLLSRTVNLDEILQTIDEHTQGEVPQCFNRLKHCKPFYPRLKCLGQLAYQTLFKETREENILVFDSYVAEKHLGERCLHCFLRTGILTQSKVPGTLLEQISKVSYAHKTVQEFFAALYIHSTPDQTSVQETVLSKCKCIKDILEMSKILIFLNGLNVDVLSLISRELMKIINEDKITPEYRSGFGTGEPLKQFQNMCVSCCKEQPHSNEVNLCLQDVFIDCRCKQEIYRENLKQLTAKNKQNIRSLYIDMNAMDDTPYSSAQEIIEYFSLRDQENIDQIHYSGIYDDCSILPLLNGSLKTLFLPCISSCWSDLLFEKVTSLQKLECISIGGFEMNHEQLTLFYDYISQRHCMRTIALQQLVCTDHQESCTGCSLDLSQHSQLRTILLAIIPVSLLHINMSSLVSCKLLELKNPDFVLRFLNCVPEHSKVNTFGIKGLMSSAARKTIPQILPLLMHVELVELSHIILGNKALLSLKMVNIRNVVLWLLTMPALVLRGIVTVLQKLPQTVSVDIDQCIITPESEFLKVKEEIKQSSKLRVIWESGDLEGSEDSDDIHVLRNNLVFETIKDSD